jgi:6-phosphogluconolactonase/glucosamine-6-phosphate isomerase/deaminase
MRYIKTTGPDGAAAYVSQTIEPRLAAGQKVAWFLSGGSAIEVAVLSAKKLASQNGLTVSLVDERYGPPGHPNSNWTKLQQAGFKAPSAELVPILIGQDIAETTKDYADFVEKLLQSSDYRIGLLGIGTDGHTAGILPGSPAADSNDLVCHYRAADYQRLTLTPKALAMLDEAVVYVVDSAKREAIENLDKNLSINDQPAQILKQIPLVTIYNGIKGDAI